jgi:hypothetical protein
MPYREALKDELGDHAQRAPPAPWLVLVAKCKFPSRDMNMFLIVFARERDEA